MTIQTAIAILEQHNIWRVYDGDVSNSPEQIPPKQITRAIETVLDYHKNGFDWNNLRDKFFYECVSVNHDHGVKVNIHPHNLFEWFKSNCG